MFSLSRAALLALVLFCSSALAAPKPQPPLQLAPILQILAASTGKSVVWLGPSPTVPQLARAQQTSPQNSIETIEEWATRWSANSGVRIEASPDALIFRATNLGTQDTGSTATSGFIESEKIQLALMEALPTGILARVRGWENSPLAQGYDFDVASETFSLAVLEAARPGFEAKLRAFLKVFGVRAVGEQKWNGQVFPYDVLLEEATSSRLRIGFSARTDALCRVGKSQFLLQLPLNQPCLPDGCSLAQSAAPLVQQLKKPAAKAGFVVQGKLGALLASKSRLVVAHNIRNWPLVVASPSNLNSARLNQILENSLGLQRRRVADLEYVTLRSDPYTQRVHELTQRSLMAQNRSSFSFFQKPLSAPRWTKISELDWPARWTLVHQFRATPQAVSEQQLLQNGEVWLARAVTLHLVLVEPANAEHPLLALKHYPVTLHSSAPPAH